MDDLDQLLTDFAARELSGQLGRAPRAFAAQRRHLPFWPIASAIAAALVLAVILAAGQFPKAPAPAPQIAQTNPAPVSPLQLDRQLYYRDIDEGTIALQDNTIPVRVIRRQVIEQTSYQEPDSATVTTEPREQLMLVRLQPY